MSTLRGQLKGGTDLLNSIERRRAVGINDKEGHRILLFVQNSPESIIGAAGGHIARV